MRIYVNKLLVPTKMQITSIIFLIPFDFYMSLCYNIVY